MPILCSTLVASVLIRSSKACMQGMCLRLHDQSLVLHSAHGLPHVALHPLPLHPATYLFSPIQAPTGYQTMRCSTRTMDKNQRTCDGRCYDSSGSYCRITCQPVDLDTLQGTGSGLSSTMLLWQSWEGSCTAMLSDCCAWQACKGRACCRLLIMHGPRRSFYATNL